MALYTAIDSVVRAVGRIVVCVEAAAELSTMSRRSLVRKLPKPDVPKMEDPSTESTSPALVGVLQPDPLRADAGVGLRRQDHHGVRDEEDERRDDGGPARRCLSSSLVSSLTDTAVSHPQ